MDDVQVPTIDVDGLAGLGREGRTVLDVRQPDEYESGHVPGAALIPLDQLPDRLHEVADGTLHVICRSGARSLAACELLRSQGHDAINVTGGTLAWIEAGHDVATGTEPG